MRAETITRRTDAQKGLTLMKKTLLALTLCFAFTPPTAQAVRSRPARQKVEMRGMWVARWSITSPQAVRNVVATAKKHNFNTLFVQARGRGDAMYPTDLEPRAEMLSEQPRDFDPLKMMVEEAHKSGLKVHAWLNTYLIWTGKNRPKSPEHVLNAHPEWIARDGHSKFTTIPSEQVEGAFLQPSNPEVQEHLYRVFTEVAKRYDVDGIHFDFVRYCSAKYDFAESTLARFRAYMEPRIGEAARVAIHKDGTRLAYVHIFPKEWAEWRRSQVTGLVKRISDGVHEMKPWMQVSAAVFANVDDAMTERGQDWRTWLQNDYLDAVCPMAYSKDTETVARQIRQAVAAANGKHVYAGIGSWRLSSDDTAKKISRVRQLGIQGINLFSYDGITQDGRNLKYLNNLAMKSFASRAGVPPMKWRGQRGEGASERGGERARDRRR